MRITIDVSDALRVSQDAGGSSLLAFTSADVSSDGMPVDGGAGPARAEAPTASVRTTDEADGGGPDQKLLADVSASEREATGGTGQFGNTASDDTDAGPGPDDTG